MVLLATKNIQQLPSNHKIKGMKKLIFLACSLFVFAMALFPTPSAMALWIQNIFLDKMPEYKDAQKKLDQQSEIWQKEIEAKQAELDKMYKDYDAEQVMLSDVLKKKREDEIFVKEKETRELQRKTLWF